MIIFSFCFNKLLKLYTFEIILPLYGKCFNRKKYNLQITYYDHKFIAVFVILFSVASCNSSNDGFSNGSSDYNHTRAVGASSNDLLSNNRYSALQIEILYMPGMLPIRRR